MDIIFSTIALMSIKYQVDGLEASRDEKGHIIINAPYIPEGFIKEFEKSRPVCCTVEYNYNKNLLH